MLCCGYTLTDFPISIRLTSLALWQSNDCPSASKATLMDMDKYFMWIHYERLHNHNKAKHNKTVCIFLGIYCNQIRKKYNHCYVGAVMTIYSNQITYNRQTEPKLPLEGKMWECLFVSWQCGPGSAFVTARYTPYVTVDIMNTIVVDAFSNYNKNSLLTLL